MKTLRRFLYDFWDDFHWVVAMTLYGTALLICAIEFWFCFSSCIIVRCAALGAIVSASAREAWRYFR